MTNDSSDAVWNGLEAHLRSTWQDSPEELMPLIEMMIGAALFKREVEKVANSRSVSFEDHWEDGKTRLLERSPLAAASHVIPFAAIAEVARTALLGSQQQLDDAIVRLATSPSIITPLTMLVEESPAFDERSAAAIAEGLECVERRAWIAASRTLVPEVERAVVNLGVKHEALERKNNRVRVPGTTNVASGVGKKVYALGKNLPDGNLKVCCDQIGAMFARRNDPNRHGEVGDWSDELLTANAIFTLYALGESSVSDG